MSELKEKIDRLQQRLDKMVEYQSYFDTETELIRTEINALRTELQKYPESQIVPLEPEALSQTPPTEKQMAAADLPKETDHVGQTYPFGTNYVPKNEPTTQPKTPAQPREKTDLEKFIGENLASKIGILITVIGVVIGAKYAIDNNLVGPVMRIVFGYLIGFGLLGFGIRLKHKYLSFSAVLVSGAMAIMYFVTFAAYSYYDLLSQSSAFVLMLIFTVFTVASAIIFDRQIIAHLGLVGAYSIPFLVSKDTGRVEILFSYIAIINIGILAVSVKKYWKLILYLSFAATWIIFGGWYLERYHADQHFSLALTFSTIFFLTFYVSSTIYKIITEADLSFDNVLLVLANSLIYFGVGYAVVDDKYQGAFAITNAGIHFLFAFVLDRFKPFERSTVYFFSALMLAFCTIAVPVQLDGSWITLLWVVEALILFSIGRIQQISLYEHFSYPLMFLAFISLLRDWGQLFWDYQMKELTQAPLQNPYFLTAVLFVSAFAAIISLNRNSKYQILIGENLHIICTIAISAIFLFCFYNTFRVEIGNYFHQKMLSTAVRESSDAYFTFKNTDLDYFNIIWQINYTMLFLTILTFLNLRLIGNKILSYSMIVLNILAIFAFLTAGLFVLSELRISYLHPEDHIYFAHGSFNIVIRYLSYIFFSMLIYAGHQSLKKVPDGDDSSNSGLLSVSDFLIHFSAIWLLSSELLNLMDIFQYNGAYKLALSILWGVYSLFLVGLGINKNRKHLRIGAIVLFAATLLKLFFYDIAELGTISKTIVLVSLGILLLIISFLYTKYKDLIFDELK